MAVSFLFSAEKEIKFKEYGENTALPAHKKDDTDTMPSSLNILCFF